jgi:3-methyladenine DNA glycosylase AlkD
MGLLDIQTLFNEVRAFCQANANPANIKKYSRYFVEGYDAYGVDFKLIVPQRDQWLGKYRASIGLQGFLDLGDQLIKTGKYEEASFAISFISQFEDEYTPQTLERVAKWLDDGIRNWAHTDILSGGVLPVFLIKKIVPLEGLSTWRHAASKWMRRAVPVTLIELLKAGFPPKSLLDFIEPMMTDEEKVVHQGLGWFLREAWKVKPAPVEDFLLRWKDRCARLIIQYATEKMTPEQKMSFKKAKG